MWLALVTDPELQFSADLMQTHFCWSSSGNLITSGEQWIDHILFIHPSTDGYLGCFHLLAIVNNATVNYW